MAIQYKIDIIHLDVSFMVVNEGKHNLVSNAFIEK